MVKRLYANGCAEMPSVVPAVGSALVLLAAVAVASMLPAARAARVDLREALRSE